MPLRSLAALALACRACWFSWFGWLLLLCGAGLAHAAPSLPLTAAEQAWVEAHPRVRVGVSAEFPPYYFATERGRYDGFVMDLMDRLAQRTGLRLEYKRYERFADVLVAMKAGEVDLTPFTSESAERREYLRFSRPLFSTQMVVVADRRLGDVDGDSGFGTYRVAVERGSTAADLMHQRYPNTRLVEYDHVEKAVLGTAAGEAELFVGFRQVAAYYMEKHLTANLVARGTLASPGTALGPAVRKDLPELAGIFDKAIDELSADEIAALAAKWMPRSAFVSRPAAKADLSARQAEWVQKHGSVRLGFDENFSPIAFKNRAGGFDGLAADLTRAMADKVGLVIAYEHGASFSDVYEAAVKGDIDVIVAAGRNSERSRQFDFVGPILRVPTVVVVATEREAEVGLNKPGRWRLALLKSHFLLPQLRSRYPNLQFLPCDTQAEVLQAVRQGEADMGLGNMKVVNQLLEARHIGALRVAGIVEHGDSELYFAVRNSKPELAQVLRAGLDAMSSTERAEIENRWLRVDWTDGVAWTQVLSVGAVILAVSALVIGSLWRSNRRSREARLTLRTARDLAEAQVAARAHFTAYLAHELRGTVGGLVGGLGMLGDGSFPAGRRGALTQAMHRSAEGLLALCERTLDFERMLAGGVDLHPEPVVLAEVLDRALAPWRVQAELKGIALTLNSHFDPAIVLNLDAVRLTQVLQNLVGNAVKFTREGGVHVSVSLTAVAGSSAHQLALRVADTGPGVPPQEQDQLFQAFAQGTEGRKVRSGAGLGLSISARIIEAMGGTIGLRSASPAGSEFEFSVPVPVLAPRA
ncbi:transporter substrate-binding domain-containing protein [Ideonella sp.]|uniref:transporter substrate-binding domain-containing protein n=1 Tax=Ideonella sp. TaxID=1929293 RepID=UPI003BB7F651